MKNNKTTIAGTLWPVVLAILVACGPQSEEEKLKAETDTLMKEVIALHDSSMARMDQLMSLSRSLKSQLDTANQADYQQAIDELEHSHEAMMDWMRGFSAFFADESLAGGHEAHGSDSHANEAATLDNLKARYDRLMAEKAGIETVDKQMKESIARAQQLPGTEAK